MAAVKKSFFLNHAQLSLLTEQIQKISSHLNSRLKESTTNAGSATATAAKAPPQPSKSSAFERTLAQKLSLPDDFQVTSPDSQNLRFLSIPAGQMSDLRFLTVRNGLLEAECEQLERDEGYRIHRQAEPFGRTSLLVSHPQSESVTISFLLPLLYPQTEFIYRIEGDPLMVDGLLPSKYEPVRAPFTISTILRRYLQIKRAQ